MVERIWHPENRSMFEIVGADDNVCYTYSFIGDAKDLNSAFITFKGGGDFTISYNRDGFFFHHDGKWWYVERRGDKVPHEAWQAAEESIMALLAFLEGIPTQ